MIGKTVYKAKLNDIGDIEVIPSIIVKEKRNGRYQFNTNRSCYKSDIGVTFFLSRKEAIQHLINELKHFVVMGEKYLERTKDQLKEAEILLAQEE